MVWEATYKTPPPANEWGGRIQDNQDTTLIHTLTIHTALPHYDYTHYTHTAIYYYTSYTHYTILTQNTLYTRHSLYTHLIVLNSPTPLICRWRCLVELLLAVLSMLTVDATGFLSQAYADTTRVTLAT